MLVLTIKYTFSFDHSKIYQLGCCYRYPFIISECCVRVLRCLLRDKLLLQFSVVNPARKMEETESRTSAQPSPFLPPSRWPDSWLVMDILYSNRAIVINGQIPPRRNTEFKLPLRSRQNWPPRTKDFPLIMKDYQADVVIILVSGALRKFSAYPCKT